MPCKTELTMSCKRVVLKQGITCMRGCINKCIMIEWI